MDRYTNWFIDAPTQWDCPPLTDAMIQRAEQCLGQKLPKAYLDVLRFHNGGMLASLYYPNPSSPRKEIPLYALNGIGGENGIDDITQYGEPLGKYLARGLGSDSPCAIAISKFTYEGLMLDYSRLRRKEPSLVYIDGDSYPKIYIEYLDVSIESFFDSLTTRRLNAQEPN